jgi:Protein of unknown function (DUF3617).
MKTGAVARSSAAACGLLFILTPSALAGHGKVGTWESKMQMSGMPAMPNMANMPPQVQAQMKARGIQMGGNVITTKFCMTAEQVAQDKPVLNHRDNCETKNLKLTGHTFTADMVCHGEVSTTGHIEMTFDSAEHYHGHITSTVAMNGQSQTHDMTIEARWLSPDCTLPPPVRR